MSMENHGGMITTEEKLLIRPPELSGNHTSSYPVANQQKLGEGNEYGLTNYLCSYFEGIFNMP
jgi:hypothetical protein